LFLFIKKKKEYNAEQQCFTFFFLDKKCLPRIHFGKPKNQESINSYFLSLFEPWGSSQRMLKQYAFGLPTQTFTAREPKL
jgi:hypothetical protein